MATFPTIIELLLPNLDLITTWVGIVLIIIAILAILFSSKFPSIISALFAGNAVKWIAIIFLLGIILIWGVSIAVDFLTSVGGIVIFWGVVITFIIFILLFGSKKLFKGGF